MSLFHEGGEVTDALEKDEVTFAPYLPHTDLNNTSCPKGDGQGINWGKTVCLWGLRGLCGFSGLRENSHTILISITVLLVFLT